MLERDWYEDEVDEEDEATQAVEAPPGWRPSVETVQALQDGAGAKHDAVQEENDAPRDANASAVAGTDLRLDPDAMEEVTIEQLHQGPHPPEELEARTLDRRVEDTQLAAKLRDAEERHDRAVGDQTADSLSDAILQSLKHYRANEDEDI